jgi:hypothetical protein
MLYDNAMKKSKEGIEKPREQIRVDSLAALSRELYEGSIRV